MKERPCVYSGIVTCSAAVALPIATGPAELCWINPLITTTGTLRVMVYDSNGVAGNLITELKYPAGATGISYMVPFNPPVACANGITLTITGTAPDGAYVGYRLV